MFSTSADDEEAKQMREDLQKIVENKPEDGSDDKKWIDAFIFVYDSSDQASFTKLMKII